MGRQNGGVHERIWPRWPMWHVVGDEGVITQPCTAGWPRSTNISYIYTCTASYLHICNALRMVALRRWHRFCVYVWCCRERGKGTEEYTSSLWCQEAGLLWWVVDSPHVHSVLAGYSCIVFSACLLSWDWDVKCDLCVCVRMGDCRQETNCWKLTDTAWWASPRRGQYHNTPSQPSA